MIERELSYHMPFERLVRLSRVASRRAFASSWWLLALFFALYIAAVALIVVFSRPLDNWLATYNIPNATPLGTAIAGFLLAVWWLRRRGLKQSRSRADYDSAVRFRQEPDGLRFATPEIEYLIKYHGISQMMLLSDGVLFSHGNLFFLLPNEAFADTAERDTLARDVFRRLNETSRDRSRAFIPKALAGNSTGTGHGTT